MTPPETRFGRHRIPSRSRLCSGKSTDFAIRYQLLPRGTVLAHSVFETAAGVEPMRQNSNFQNSLRTECDARARRIRSDLESRGVTREFSLLVARRLGAISSDLSGSEYEAVLDGVAAAHRVHAEARDVPAEYSIGVNEIQRLTEGFASELHKLEEGLQILSAYVVRMGGRALRRPAESLH